VRRELHEHVDLVECLVDGREHRHAKGLAAEGGGEVLPGTAARDRIPERDVRRGQRPFDDGTAADLPTGQAAAAARRPPSMAAQKAAWSRSF
jgi:hypothetical protein